MFKSFEIEEDDVLERNYFPDNAEVVTTTRMDKPTFINRLQELITEREEQNGE